MSKPRLCRWCHWWVAEYGASRDGLTNGPGRCHFNPPTALAVPGGSHASVWGVFPTSYPDDFCSKWREWQDPAELANGRNAEESAKYLETLNSFRPKEPQATSADPHSNPAQTQTQDHPP